MAKQSTSEYAQYAKLRKQFGLLGEEFERRCDPSGPRVYHQRLIAVDSPNDDPPLLNRFVVKCDTLALAWSAFIDIYRGRLLQKDGRNGMYSPTHRLAVDSTGPEARWICGISWD